jgi:glycosyltransferase involved in cell wall biosynthesis
MMRTTDAPRPRRDIPGGPAVLLGTADSIFTQTLADYWRGQGLDVVVVTLGWKGTWLSPEVQVVNVESAPRRWKDMWRPIVRPFGTALERWMVARGRARFTSVTGKPQPDPWESSIWYWVENAFRLADAVLSLEPRFVFGQEVAAYGLATALCRGMPRILFPWGSDIYNTAETWWGAEWLVRYALRHVDLVVPSSSAAAKHIVRRFGVAPEKVRSISWGIDLAAATRAGPHARAEICSRWQIDPRALIVMNCRRFRPFWGSETALRAFLRCAAECPMAHFVLIAGPSADAEIRHARTEIESRGLQSRFTIADRELSLAEFGQFASVSDVFCSLVRRGDMRSSSVLHLAAAGAAPVIGDVEEYRDMVEQGFQARLVPPGDPDAVAGALRMYIEDELLRRIVAERNRTFVETYEDQVQQMKRLLEAIHDVCRQH